MLQWGGGAFHIAWRHLWTTLIRSCQSKKSKVSWFLILCYRTKGQREHFCRKMHEMALKGARVDVCDSEQIFEIKKLFFFIFYLFICFVFDFITRAAASKDLKALIFFAQKQVWYFRNFNCHLIIFKVWNGVKS